MGKPRKALVWGLGVASAMFAFFLIVMLIRLQRVDRITHRHVSHPCKQPAQAPSQPRTAGDQPPSLYADPIAQKVIEDPGTSERLLEDIAARFNSCWTDDIPYTADARWISHRISSFLGMASSEAWILEEILLGYAQLVDAYKQFSKQRAREARDREGALLARYGEDRGADGFQWNFDLLKVCYREEVGREVDGLSKARADAEEKLALLLSRDTIRHRALKKEIHTLVGFLSYTADQNPFRARYW